jgi:FAD:protein FMN transferase
MKSLIILFLLVLQVNILGNSTHQFTRENTLGTSLEIKIISHSDDLALEAYESGLNELTRLKKIFNAYDEQSEISSLSNHRSTVRLSKELLEVFKIAKQAQQLSNGRFCSVSPLLAQVWSEAEATQKIPTTKQLQKISQVIANAEQFQVKQNASGGFLMRHSAGLKFNLDAIAKGYIIDAVFEKIIASPGVTSALVNIGGDLRSGGKGNSFEASIRDPRRASASLSSFKLKGRSLASSGGSERFYNIQGKRYSHIIDARNGLPATDTLAASVIAPNAAQADMLATVLSMMPVKEGLKMIGSLPHCECLLLSPSGQINQSKGWPQTLGYSTSRISIELKLINSISGQKFKRHYAVVWIEDSKGNKVRDITLWYRARESKYLKSLASWWKKGGDKISKDRRLLKTISEATKRLGSYTVRWDERDNKRKSLPKGKYTVCIEVNRERPGKDTPTICKIEIDTNKKKFSIKGKDQPELGDVKVSR